MNSWTRRLLTLAMLLCAAACSSGGSGDNPADEPQRCASSENCGEGEICTDGVCVVPSALRITTERLPPALAGSGWSAQVEAAGARGSLDWSLVGPSWVAIDASTGKLTGRAETPDPVGALLQIRVTDAGGQQSEAQLRLQVRECAAGAEMTCEEDAGSSCSTGVRLCGTDGFFGACTRLVPSTDASRCGAGCGTCAPGSACVGGQCTCGGDEGCGDGSKCCGGACISVIDDEENCGQCGNACPAADDAGTVVACVDGTCVQSCQDGFADCDQRADNGCEEPLNTDENCGGCFVDCTTMTAPQATDVVCGDDATPSCEAVCGDAAWADCDGELVTGCERRMTTASDCGGCDRACPQRPFSTPVCQFAERCLGATRDPACDGPDPLCTIACDAGRADCSGGVADGCESDLLNDEQNCGGCGNECPGECTNGTCHVTCTWPRANCDGNGFNGCETDLRTDVSHCGMCGSSCEFGEDCESGSCCNGGGTSGNCLPGCCAGLSCTRDPQSGDRGCY